VASIPLRLAITDHPGGVGTPTCADDPADVRIARRLMEQAELGEASPWGPFIQVPSSRTATAVVPCDPMGTTKWLLDLQHPGTDDLAYSQEILSLLYLFLVQAMHVKSPLSPPPPPFPLLLMLTLYQIKRDWKSIRQTRLRLFLHIRGCMQVRMTRSGNTVYTPLSGLPLSGVSL